jgi:hypothetical protein
LRREKNKKRKEEGEIKMGHAIEYNTYSATWTMKQIAADVLECVKHQGDHYGTDKVRFPTDKVFDTCEEARKYINANDKGWYDGIAVKFLDFDEVKDSEKIKELRAKIADTIQKKNEYIAAHSVKAQKATYIGCQSCGSKLNKEKLRGERCPLCQHDLRAASTLDRILSFDKRIEEYNKKINQELLKQKKNAKVKWLVKYEYHC